MLNQIFALTLCTFLWGTALSFAQSQEVIDAIEGKDSPLILGVLEFGKEKRVLYPLFKKHQVSRWETIDSKEKLPSAPTWKVIFGGRDFGSFISRLEGRSYQLGSTVDDSKLPIYPNREQRFYNWNGPHRHRPLILSNRDYSIDPQHWRSFRPEKNTDLRALKILKELKIELPLCSKNKLQMSPLKFRHIQAEYAYRSRSGALLLGFQFKSKLKCEDSVMDPIWTEHWVYLPPGKAPGQFLGREITPVGGGDYNADRKEEWVFKYSGFNKDGYWLFTDNFSKVLKSTWKAPNT